MIMGATCHQGMAPPCPAHLTCPACTPALSCLHTTLPPLQLCSHWDPRVWQAASGAGLVPLDVLHAAAASQQVWCGAADGSPCTGAALHNGIHGWGCSSDHAPAPPRPPNPSRPPSTTNPQECAAGEPGPPPPGAPQPPTGALQLPASDAPAAQAFVQLLAAAPLDPAGSGRQQDPAPAGPGPGLAPAVQRMAAAALQGIASAASALKAPGRALMALGDEPGGPPGGGHVAGPLGPGPGDRQGPGSGAVVRAEAGSPGGVGGFRLGVQRGRGHFGEVWRAVSGVHARGVWGWG
jgi:hypothetical protein